MLGSKARVALVTAAVLLYVICSRGADPLKALSLLALAAYLLSEYYMRRIGEVPSG